MNLRKTMSVAAGVLALVVVGGRPVAAADAPAKAAPPAAVAPAEAALVTASGRQVFWRGEQVGVSFTTPLAAPAEAVVTLAPAGQEGVPVYRGKLSPVAGVARLQLLLPTDRLGDGTYTATAQVGDQKPAVTFTVRETTVASPGMVINEMGVAPQSRQVSQSAEVDFMADLFTHEKGPDAAAERKKFDELADGGMLLWSHDASRALSFTPPFSSPTTDGEYRRRLVLGNTYRMRYPAFAGSIFDYDHYGIGIEDYAFNVQSGWYGSYPWWTMGPQYQQYLDVQQRALADTFKQETGFEPFTAADTLKLAAAVKSPEGMGYIDQPTRRWAGEIATRSPAVDATELAKLKTRGTAWFDNLMALNARRYTGYLASLRGLDPTLVHSTANTVNHSTPRGGNYHPDAYGPLDFRFVAVWDDQGGAPEHIYETALAATLLNGNRQPGQPLWIDTVFNMNGMPGVHFRNSLMLAGLGAQGTGYSFEMGSSLSYGNRGRKMLEANSPQSQEAALSGRLMKQFGGVLAEATPSPRVGLLYSKRQIAMTPYAQSYTDGMFKMLYVLSHVGLPPVLVTEEMLAGAAPLPESIDAVLVLGQHEAMPPAALKGLEAFAARGGRVIADTASAVTWPFLERSAALDIPFRDLGCPWNMNTAYNRGDETVGDLRTLAATRGPQLRTLLQDAIQQLPLEGSDPDVAVCTLAGGKARFVTVTNDSALDLGQLFSDEAKQSGILQRFLFSVEHGRQATSSWIPLQSSLRLSPSLGTDTAIYDLFSRTRVQPVRRGGARTVACDLTAMPGRMYAIYPSAVGAGTLTARQKIQAGDMLPVRYQATDSQGAALAAVVPVELTLRTPQGEPLLTLYRATRADGVLTAELPTGAFLKTGEYRVEARQLLDGSGAAVPVTVQAGAMPQASVVAGATVRDPAAVRRFLAGKPELVVPVFDPALLPAAERIVAGLKQQGVAARVWQEPKTVTYVLGYTVAAAEQPDNAAVDRGEAIGRVRFQQNRDRMINEFYGSSFTGYRFGKSVLLLGTPGTNPVLDAVKASGLPWRDGITEAPGGALVQWLPQALSRDADTLIVSATDAAGLDAGIAALLNPPTSDPVTDGVRTARQRVLRGRGMPLDTAPVVVKGLTGKGMTALQPQAVTERFSMVSVTDVQPMGDRLVAALGRFGQNIAVVNPDGQVTLLPAIAVNTSSLRGCGQRVIVTGDAGLTTAWSPTGERLWNAVGDFKALLPTDDVIVESGKILYRVSPDGKSVVSTDPLPETAKKAMPVYKAEVVTEKLANGQVTLKGTRLVDTRSGQEITGFALTTEKPVSWENRWIVQQRFLESADGEVLVAYQYDAKSSGIQIYRKSTGKVATESLPADPVCAVAIAADGKQVAVAGESGRVRIVSAEGATHGDCRAGAYPRLFPLPTGGFAIGSSDGLLTVVGADAKVARVVDLDRETVRANRQPEAIYAGYRGAKWLSWFTPPSATGDLPLTNFHLYLRDQDGTLRMVSWPAGKTVDFRWSDAVQGPVAFPKTGQYRVTVKAAAKYFDDLPMNQPSWDPILKVRDQVVKNERPAPTFTLYLNGKPVGTLTPEGGALKPFVTQRITKGWSKLDPKPEEFTTFTGTLDAPAGSGQLGIAPTGMTDCWMTELRVE
jgi:hypothetical protein